MKKIFIYLLIILLLCSLVFAGEENLHHASSIKLEHSVANEISISPLQSDYMVDYFRVWLYLFAQDDDMQTVTSQSGSPSPRKAGDSLLFEWNNPSSRSLSFDFSQEVLIRESPVKIKDKVSFPLTDVPVAVIEFTEFTGHIDSSPEIIALASELASGVDDLFVLENILADWVNRHVEYSLSTATSEANIPSSIVLEQEYGVCDEITNLFISLNRALGVPARFVSGIAYSESELFSEPWGNHGWAEVYFPGFGWVAYDVTYEQFAGVDATHLALQKGVDGVSASVEYKTSGYHYDFSQQSLEMETIVLDVGPKRASDVSIDISFYDDIVAFGSYNVVFATVKNVHPYYVSERISLVPTSDTSTVSDEVHRITLGPFESKELFWIVQVSSDLSSGYYYNFPMVVVDSFGYQTQDEFQVREESTFIPLEDLSSFKDLPEESALRFVCSGPEEVLVSDEVSVSCSSSSISSSEFPVTFCLGDECKQVSSNGDVMFSLPSKSLGVHTYEVLGSAKTLSGSSFVTVRTTDLESLSFVEVSYPESVSSSTEIVIDFSLNKSSVASPKDVTARISHSLFSEEWVTENILSSQKYSLSIPANMLTFDTNEFVLSYEFVNKNGEIVSDSMTFSIVVDSVSKEDFLVLLFNSVNVKVNTVLQKEHSETTGLISVIVFAVALSVFVWIIQRLIRLLLSVGRKK